MKGQTIIEVLVALGAAVVVVTAIAIVVISAINNTQYSKNQNLATQYAQQGMEILRQIRDSTYATFNTYNGTYCLDKDQTVLGGTVVDCTTPNVDSYIRKVVIEKSSPGCGNVITKVTVQVSWTDEKCTSGSYCHAIETTTCMGPADVVPTP